MCGSVCGSVGFIQVSSVWHYPPHSIILSRGCTSSHMPFFDALKSTVPEERQLVDNVYETTLSDKYDYTTSAAMQVLSSPCTFISFLKPSSKMGFNAGHMFHFSSNQRRKQRADKYMRKVGLDVLFCQRFVVHIMPPLATR